MSEAFAPKVAEIAGLGMITLRGDLRDPGISGALGGVFGTDGPAIRQIIATDAGALAWMSPDEALILCPMPEVPARLAALQDALRDQFATVADVSDARAVFEISGPGAREALSKLTPMDLHPGTFGPGEMRRTRLAQVAAAVWMPEPDRIRLICFRSVAQYVADLLHLSAAPGGALRVFSD